LIGWPVTFSRQTASAARLFSRSRKLRKRGFLDQNEKGHLTPTLRAGFSPGSPRPHCPRDDSAKHISPSRETLCGDACRRREQSGWIGTKRQSFDKPNQTGRPTDAHLWPGNNAAGCSEAINPDPRNPLRQKTTMLTPTIAYFFTSPTDEGSTGAAPAIDTNGDLFFQAKTEIIELPNKGTVAHPSYGSPVQLNYDPSYGHGPLSGIYPDFPSAAMGSSTAVDDGIGASGNAITHTPPGASNSDRTLYSFPDGTQLGGLLIDGANNIWGTTYTSSSSLGMIFELSNPNPAMDTTKVENMTYQDAVYYFANHGTLISSMADNVLGTIPSIL
jgi:hypothetical protein